MNTTRFRVIFNRVRGVMMAVAESTHARGNSVGDPKAGGTTSQLTVAVLRPIAFHLLIAVGAVMVVFPARAQIVADPGAAPSIQPQVLETASGVPMVNIRAPSAAGVSRNAYSQFDVSEQGVILNNSRTNAQTELGGWVQGNPHLAGGSARVILNEVNSSHPSFLQGHVEVAGSRAQVVIANPAGIECNGCGFINASRSTLTTGVPRLEGGNLIGYRVGGGSIRFAGNGMNDTATPFTEVIARAVAVNAGIWANSLNVVAGSNQADIDSNGAVVAVTAQPDTAGSAAAFAIDVAALGGMYAGKIHLIGTENGFGMRNAGSIGAAAGQVALDINGRLINTGEIAAAQAVRINAKQIENEAEGEILSGSVAHFQTDSSLINRGLVDGQSVRIDSGELRNLGTARIHGDTIGISVTALEQSAEAAGTPVIAARGSLDIGVETLRNEEDAWIFSAGDLRIGGELDADGRATAQAGHVTNIGGTIEALGRLDIAAQIVSNLNAGLVTEQVVLGTEHFDQFTPRYTSVRLNTADYPEAHIGNVHIEGRTAGPYRFREYWRYQYSATTTETRLVESRPGSLLSGGDLRLHGDVENRDSRIIAGAALDVIGGNLDSHNTEGELVTTFHNGVARYYDYDGWKRCSSAGGCYDVSTSPYRPAPIVMTYALSGGLIAEQSDASNNAPPAGLTGAGALFRPNPDPQGGWLVETDPRFAGYRQWLSSDYMLTALSIDPVLAQKRLGDGFHEQRQVAEQVAQLTGRRFLEGHANDESQYLALMNAGLTLSGELELIPGVALSPEQVAQLTSDIVWLVERSIRLPDGATERVLVPQVYVQLRAEDLHPTTGLMVGNEVRIDLTGDLSNSGTIAGRSVLSIGADNIRNLGGTLAAASVHLEAQDDIVNQGGSVVARDRLIADAGRDLMAISTTRSSAAQEGASHATRTNLDRVAGLYVTGDAGILVASAGNDLTFAGALIVNAGTDGHTALTAGNDLHLDTVNTAESTRAVRNVRNFVAHGESREVGTRIESTADVIVLAGQDVISRAATVNSAEGTLEVIAGRDVVLEAGRETSEFESARHTRRSGTFGSTTKSELLEIESDKAVGSSLSGRTIVLTSGRDLTVSGSSVVSDIGTTLVAGRDLKIVADEERNRQFHEYTRKQSGLYGSGMSVTIGTKQLSQNTDTVSSSAVASTVGSVGGDVLLTAGQQYTQTGSDVLSPVGDIDITGQGVLIEEAREHGRSVSETKFRQSGLTLALSSPVISAIQTAQQMAQAAGDTDSSRMKALAAASTALASKGAYDAVRAGQGSVINDKPGQIGTGTDAAGEPTSRDATTADQMGGINLSISIGSSKSSSTSSTVTDTAAGSNVSAGGNISITATGAGEDSDLIIQGSQIRADGNVTLEAEDAIKLLAARNTSELRSDNKNSSASIGVSIGTSGFAITAAMSQGKGKARGDDLSWNTTQVQAGETVRMTSGGDTTLAGARVEGERVVADVGGNLHIESLQDVSTYDSKQKSSGFSISIPISGFSLGGISGSVSSSQSKISSDYRSVTERSGIEAGDGGFHVTVGGDTTLIGAAIASTDIAVIEGRNHFETGGELALLDVRNQAEYEAKAASVHLGSGVSHSGKLVPLGSGAGIGSDEGSATSTTTAGISGIAGDQFVRTGDAPSGIDRIFDAEKVAREIEAQVQITQAFGQQAHQAVNAYVQETRNDLNQKLREADHEGKAVIQDQLDELLLQERVMNVLIGAVTGMGSTALAKEALSAAAHEMRQIMIEDSKKFPGVVDAEGKTLDNISAQSEGVRGDAIKLGGTRVDLDLLCGLDNSRCAIQRNVNGEPILDVAGKTQLEIKEGKVQFLGSLEDFMKTADGKKMIGATGGLQGFKGTLLGVPYEAGSWQDRLIEAFSGTHDYIGGRLSGLYDEHGNANRDRSRQERVVHEVWSGAAIVPSAPFAMSELMSPEVWKGVSILLGSYR